MNMVKDLGFQMQHSRKEAEDHNRRLHAQIKEVVDHNRTLQAQIKWVNVHLNDIDS